MENIKIQSVETKSLKSHQNEEIKGQDKNSYSGLFEIPQPSLNFFAGSSSKSIHYDFERNWFDASEAIRQENWLFSEENSFRTIRENQGLEYNFNFDLNPQKATQNNYELAFNLPLEWNFPELARSYENELTFDVDFSASPRCLSQDVGHNAKTAKGMKFADKIEKRTKIHPKIGEISGANESFDMFGNHQNKLEERKSSSSCSPISYDEEKLQKLIQCLKKTKGANLKCIDEDIISKTVEFGQQKVAEMLKIPYRRYKSILGKVGIKSSAGRKIKSTNFEVKLVEWAFSIKSSSSILTRKMIHDQAIDIINQLIEQGENSLRKVRLSKGWLDKFIKRHPDIKDYLTSQKGKKS